MIGSSGDPKLRLVVFLKASIKQPTNFYLDNVNEYGRANLILAACCRGGGREGEGGGVVVVPRTEAGHLSF